MNILGIYPSERRYRKPLRMLPITTDPYAQMVQPTHETVANVISIDVGGEDIDQVIALLNAHARGAHRDPRVQEAWERYQIMLRLTGDDQ
jgi:hypothetical protein